MNLIYFFFSLVYLCLFFQNLLLICIYFLGGVCGLDKEEKMNPPETVYGQLRRWTVRSKVKQTENYICNIIFSF